MFKINDLNKNELLILILGLVAIALEIYSANFFQAVILLFTTFVFLRRSIAIVPGSIIAGILMYGSLLSGSFFNVIFVILIAYTFYAEWTNGFKINNRLLLVHLNQQAATTYSYMFLVIVGFDVAFGLMSGMSVSEVLQPSFIASSIVSILLFLAVILAARKTFDAVYFYIGYIVMLFGYKIYYLYAASNYSFNLIEGLKLDVIIIFVVIFIQLTMAYLFVEENK
jgi:hypothetical protein